MLEVVFLGPSALCSCRELKNLIFCVYAQLPEMYIDWRVGRAHLTVALREEENRPDTWFQIHVTLHAAAHFTLLVMIEDLACFAP